jgi:hypothetical protein
MTWYDAGICVPATDETVEILYLKNGKEKIVQASIIEQGSWLVPGDYVPYDSVLRWRQISQ